MAELRQLQIFLEQPDGSQMPNYKPIRQVLKRMRALKNRVFLGSYDITLGVVKPLQIWSNAQFASRLCRIRPELAINSSSRFYSKGFLGEYTGKADLAFTGNYPDAFGEAVIEYYSAARSRIAKRLEV